MIGPKVLVFHYKDRIGCSDRSVLESSRSACPSNEAWLSGRRVEQRPSQHAVPQTHTDCFSASRSNWLISWLQWHGRRSALVPEPVRLHFRSPAMTVKRAARNSLGQAARVQGQVWALETEVREIASRSISEKQELPNSH